MFKTISSFTRIRDLINLEDGPLKESILTAIDNKEINISYVLGWYSKKEVESQVLEKWNLNGDKAEWTTLTTPNVQCNPNNFNYDYITTYVPSSDEPFVPNIFNNNIPNTGTLTGESRTLHAIYLAGNALAKPIPVALDHRNYALIIGIRFETQNPPWVLRYTPKIPIVFSDEILFYNYIIPGELVAPVEKYLDKFVEEYSSNPIECRIFLYIFYKKSPKKGNYKKFSIALTVAAVLLVVVVTGVNWGVDGLIWGC
ncbi:MAG TPA: hypothetical protein VIV55_08210 [Flavobacterium sp.]